MESEIKAEIKRIKQLRQFKETPDAQVEKIAQKNLILRELTSSGRIIQTYPL
jgi:hypothetical protein